MEQPCHDRVSLTAFMRLDQRVQIGQRHLREGDDEARVCNLRSQNGGCMGVPILESPLCLLKGSLHLVKRG